MNKDYILKRIEKIKARIKHMEDNYDTLYNRHYKLERNRVKRVNERLDWEKHRLEWFNDYLIREDYDDE
jgi:hypothetical protein